MRNPSGTLLGYAYKCWLHSLYIYIPSNLLEIGIPQDQLANFLCVDAFPEIICPHAFEKACADGTIAQVLHLRRAGTSSPPIAFQVCFIVSGTDVLVRAASQ